MLWIIKQEIMKSIFAILFILSLIFLAEAIYCKKGIISFGGRRQHLTWCEDEKCYVLRKKSKLGKYYLELGCLSLIEAEAMAQRFNASAIQVHSMISDYGPELNICGFNYCNQKGRIDATPQFIWQQIYNFFDPLVKTI